MEKSRLWGIVSACVLTLTSITTVQAAPVSGQGTWETTLEGRLETAPGSGVFLAYYDTVLDITWWADADISGSMNWDTANAWAAGLILGGVSGWRLPTNMPLNGSSYNTAGSTDGTTDMGYATTTTDGTDGGWRDGSDNPVSEMGHMYYVTLGNMGFCDPGLPWCTEQTGWGLSNTGPFSNIQPAIYWSGSELDSSFAWLFGLSSGYRDFAGGKDANLFAWAVRPGDVSAVPVPAAVWLFGSGLLGLIGIARRKKAA